MVMELIKFANSPEAERLISTVKKQMAEGLTLVDMINLLNRIEKSAKAKGKTLKEVCDESMDLYERS